MTEYVFELFADYFQFYLQDENADGIDGESWTDGALEARLALESGAFAVSTARNMDVPVTVAILDGPPDQDVSGWDHAVEFSIDVPSGRLVVAGCMDFFPDAERIPLRGGTYEARVLFANLEALSEDGLGGEDRYRVELWTGQAKPLRVIKQHKV